MLTQLTARARCRRRFMRRRMAVTIATALFAVAAPAALAQNSESAPPAAAPMKSKPKTPARGTALALG
jgi:hypothetical protein